MIKALRFSTPAILIPLALMSGQTLAQEDDIPRYEKNYIGIYYTGFQHRSVGLRTRERGWEDGGTLVLGGHLSDYFHAEFRGGAGEADSEVDTGLRLEIDYFASWYMGMHYPVTPWANVYAQFGFSHIRGEASMSPAPEDPPDTEPSQRTPDPNAQYRHMEGDFPASTFAFSWIAGADLELFSDMYFVLEGGRLFKDTESEVSTYQFSGGFRYEF